MDEIRRQDQKLFVSELLVPARVAMAVGGLVFAYFISMSNVMMGIVIAIAALASVGTLAYRDSVERRFYNKRMRALWSGCQDRLARFEEVLRKMKGNQIAEFKEMPKTIRGLADSLYLALRKADLIAHEVMATEKDMLAQPPAWKASGNDAQSQELYRLADKNIAEYRQEFAGVMAGVHRAEAQSAVYMTTLDTLRMKMIGYRLVGRSPELSSQDFLEAIAEARAQLQSIDTALEELDLGHYPKMIAAVPPPVPEELRNKQ